MPSMSQDVRNQQHLDRAKDLIKGARQFFNGNKKSLEIKGRALEYLLTELATIQAQLDQIEL